MGQLDNQPEHSGSADPREMEQLLRSMTQQLRDIQQNMGVQLSQDMARLQAEQSRLTADIQRLQNQQQQLQSRQMQSAPGRIANQQQWTKQLAQVMASQLQAELSDRFKQLAAPPPPPPPLTGAEAPPSLSPPQATPSNYNENAYRLLASLDTTLNTTFKTLQQELSSYQSSLSQQLGRMHSLQQQGEVILETLVDRLIEQLQEEASNVQTTAEIISGGPQQRLAIAQQQQQRAQTGTAPPSSPTQPRDPEKAAIAEPRTAPPATPAPTPNPENKAFLTGIILALFSSLTISFQNIVTRVILSDQSLFGLGAGQILAPGVGNSLLILAIRMFMVVLVMGLWVAPGLYPNTWRDLKQLGNPEKRGKVWYAIGSGICLFASQFCIYIALGNIATGIAITLFFIFPPVTAILAWLIFGARPTFIFALATLTIFSGCFLTVSANIGSPGFGDPRLGAVMAIMAGLTFAGYVIFTQLSSKKLKLHPAPFSVINFTVILLLSVPLVLIGGEATGVNDGFLAWTVAEGMWGALFLGSLALAATTAIGYVLNNFAIPIIGAPLASVIAATGPGLTSLMALIFIGEELGLNEWLGVFIVSVWVLGISVDNMNKQKKPAPPPSAPGKQKA